MKKSYVIKHNFLQLNIREREREGEGQITNLLFAAAPSFELGAVTSANSQPVEFPFVKSVVEAGGSTGEKNIRLISV